MSIPHATTADDTYHDMFIPKGSMVLQNTWAINHDEEEFEAPDQFIPERFIGNRFGVRKEAEGDDENRRVIYG